MASITVRGLKQETKDRLRIRAAQHGRSMEAEVRAVLDGAVTDDGSQDALGTRIRELFAGADDLHGLIPERTEAALPAPVGEENRRAMDSST